MSFRKPSVLPGFGLTFGFTTFFLSAIVLLPLAALVLAAASMHWSEFVHVVLGPARARLLPPVLRCVAARRHHQPGVRLHLAWTLVRYEFPGRKLIDALIDMPFALPTAVSGIALTTVFSQNGWIGRYLEPLGIKVAYTWLGVTLALTLISMPFAVRARAAGAARGTARPRGRGRDARRQSLLRLPPHHPADRAARAPHRLHPRVRARRWASTAR